MDSKEILLLNRAKTKKREQSLNDYLILYKKLASLISMAVWGDSRNFNKPLEYIKLLEKEELSESEFTKHINSEMEKFLNEKGLI